MPIMKWKTPNTCKSIAQHYENFPVGWFIPRKQRPPIYALYAFARTADDFADEPSYEGERLQRLDEWGQRLEAAQAGIADHPVFSALAQVFRETTLPPSLLADLLVAFRWDVVKKRYNYQELMEYCRYSANPIGRAVLILFGITDPHLLELSDKICTGIQLVNHWQDIGVDLKKDRVYLPEEDFSKFGYSYEALQEQRVTEPFRSLLRFEISRTRSLFAAGRPLLGHLPRRLRWQVELMWGGPLKILDKIEAVDFDIFQHRPTLSQGELVKLFLVNRLTR